MQTRVLIYFPNFEISFVFLILLFMRSHYSIVNKSDHGRPFHFFSEFKKTINTSTLPMFTVKIYLDIIVISLIKDSKGFSLHCLVIKEC